MFTFRFRCDVAPGCSISTDERELCLFETPHGHRIKLVGDDEIAKSRRLVLKADGWESTDAAAEAAARYSDALVATLVHHRVGVELWPRRGEGMMFPAGLQMLQAEYGHRVLNDRAGVTVYETEPPTRFVKVKADVVRGVSSRQFIETFQRMASGTCNVSERTRVSIDLFNASFFEPAADTRLIVLVMAAEALLELAPRSADAVAIVESFLAAVQQAELPAAERDSLRGALRWLRKESIRGAGRRMATQYLGGKTYDGRSASDFFADCYDLRSQLVHGGNIRDVRGRAGMAAAQLEVFVSDLIVAHTAG